MDTQIQTFLFNALLTIITTGLPIIITYLVKFIIQHTNAKQLNTASVIAKNAVLFTKQITSDLNIDNSVKLNSALNAANQLAKKYGINLEDSQWRSLLEASLIEIKNGLNDVKDASDIITPSTELPSLEGQNLANNEVVESAESVAIVELQSNIVNIQETQKLALPEDMLSPLYASILEKSNEKAKLAVEQVITDITRSIAVEGEK